MKKMAEIIKTSKDLDALYDNIYQQFFDDGKYLNFAPHIKKIATIFYENEYLGIAEYTKCGTNLFKLSNKSKKPIYMVFGKRSNTYAFFVATLNEVKGKLLQIKKKLDLNSDLKNSLKLINSSDAAILAYLSLAPKPLKDESVLSLLSNENLSLGKCLINKSGKYSKEVKRQAEIYREWAIYKNSSSSKRKNLNVYSLKKS